MDYIAIGNVMVDQVRDENGVLGPVYIGGPSFFALCGMRTFSKSVLLQTNVGSDFFDYYGDWFDKNNVSREGIEIRSDYTNYHILEYAENGVYKAVSKYGTQFGMQNLGYLTVTPEQIFDLTTKHKPKAIYLYAGQDKIYWQGVEKSKKAAGYKLMLEAQTPLRKEGLRPETVSKFFDSLKYVDALSINLHEAGVLLDMDPIADEKKIVEAAKTQFSVESVFLRAGEKGAYAITEGKSYFLPSIAHLGVIDPTGCGNCSSGGFAYAIGEGYDPVMAVAYANVSASYNLAQYGAYLDYNDKVMEEAKQLVEKVYKTVF